MVEKLKAAIHAQHGIKSATILLAITLFFSNVLGLVRNVVLASHATSLTQLDPYYAAFRLPDLIFNVLILGAISSAFIPVYTKTAKEKGKDTGFLLANTLLGDLLAIVFIGIILIWIFSPVIVPLLVPKFSAIEQVQTVHLTRIMLLSPLFFTMSYVAGALLNAHKRFFSYSMAPLIYNLAIIIGAWMLPRFGIEGVAWAVVAGALLHFLTQLPTLLSMGFRLAPKIHFGDATVRLIIRLTIPRTFSILMAQIALLGFTVLASDLRPGALTIFSLSNDLQTTPAIIFGASLATAAFPTLSDAVAEDDAAKFQRYLHRTLRISLFTIIPLTVFVFLLRAQLMRLYIGLGHNISWSDTIRAINTIAWFAFSFMAQALTFIVARAFYAKQDTKRPMYSSVIGTIVTLTLAVIFMHTSYFGKDSSRDVAGLAASYGIGMWVQALILVRWLPSKWKGNLSTVYGSARSAILLSMMAGLAIWFTKQVVGDGLHIDQTTGIDFGGIGTHTVGKLFIQAAVATIVGGVVYLGLAKLLRLEELDWLIKLKARGSNEQESPTP